MNSQMPRTTTSYGKVTRIEAHGFFLEAQGKQYFVPFADYPVFRRATVAQIFEMEARFPGCFHWPTIDPDIGLDALEHPEKYPLIAHHNREPDTKQEVSKMPIAKAA